MSEVVDDIVLRKYELKRKLGKGAYGIVWQAIDRRTHQVVAVKKIFDAFQNATDAQRTFREIMFLQEVSGHENIIRLLNVLKAANDRDIYLVFEYMETDLHAVIRANILEDVHKRFIMYQLFKSLKYLHSGELLHRDIKPNNLLLNSDCSLKLADFGLARSLSSLLQDDGTIAVLSDYVATRWYRAPEILLGCKKYSFGVDMWSSGCILAELIGSKPVFPGSSTLDQLERIAEVTGPPSRMDLAATQSSYSAIMLEGCRFAPQRKLTSMFPDISPDAEDLLRSLLQFNPDKRITAEEALRHPYVSQFHNPLDEPCASKVFTTPINENTQFSIHHYRTTLYAEIVRRKRKMRQRKKEKALMMTGGDESRTKTNDYRSRSSAHAAAAAAAAAGSTSAAN
eukprot:g4350.t1